MGYYISDKQVLASAMERSMYRPVEVRTEGCRRTDEILKPGHPMYSSLCNVFTLVNTTDKPVTIPVFPTGCVALVFLERSGVQQSWLCGAFTEIRKIVMEPKDQYLVLRFMPGCNMAFLDCEASWLTDRCRPVEETIRNGSRLMKIAERDIPVSLKAVLMSRVLRVESFERDSDYLIHFCAEEILNRGGVITISELAQKAGFSERYIGQIFHRYTGLSPKAYAEIIRLQASLRQVMPGGGRTQAPVGKDKSLLEIAVDCGYFDHAHMNRAYKRRLHCSSGALRRHGTAAINMENIKPLLD